MNATVLIVEDDRSLAIALEDLLSRDGYNTVVADCGKDALRKLSETRPDLVISDLQMAPMSGDALLEVIREKYPWMPFIIMTAYGSVKNAVNLVRNGATDYLTKPFDPDQLLEQIRKVVSVEGADCKQKFIAEDRISRDIRSMASRVAQTDATVLITGESGSGKEVVARYIHDTSPRAARPFMAMNCAAIPSSMLESILFGHEKGAFTGAVKSMPGKFEQAQGGTLLLDEISEIEPELQAKLLRVLQEREVERLGSRTTLKLDVRVLATSNRDIPEEVACGRFREDLYYRLSVFPIEMPPLRDRPGDIMEIAHHLLGHHARRLGTVKPELTSEAIEALHAHQWPGNVRELDNVLQRALILSTGSRITAANLRFLDRQESTVSAARIRGQARDGVVGKGNLREQESQLIVQALIDVQGSRKRAAEQLGITSRTLRNKITRLREQGVHIPG